VERSLSEKACRSEELDALYDHRMVFTCRPHCHIVLFEFLAILFDIFNWFYSCAGGELVLYVAEEMSNMRYQGGMPFIILDL
jgi:hypothetical protein